MKKKWLAILTSCLMLGSTCGCSLSNLFGGDSVQNSSSLVTPSEDAFETLLEAQGEKKVSADQTLSFTVNKELGDRNYMKLLLSTDVDLYGEFVYCDLADTSKVVEECFYVQAGETEFKQFLDAYRPNGIGLFEKRLQSITLKNLSGKEGTVSLQSVSVCDRDIPKVDCEVYVQKGELKVGVDLALGGSITYVSRTAYNGQTVDEIIDANDNIKYGVDLKNEAGAQHLSSEVNLVAIYDPGRQIQQSYYASVGGTNDVATGANGYQRGWCYTDSSEGDWWPYNPVQAGDCADNPAQLIDYEIKDNSIYVKARPMDWGKGWKEDWASQYEQKAKEVGGLDKLGLVKGGVTTKAYVENEYTIKGNLLYVNNEFIDWNGFVDMNQIPPNTNEIPAFFPVHVLNTFVTYKGLVPWAGDKVGLFKQTNPPSRSEVINQVKGTEDWFAWVNDQDFGMGIYVPNTDYYTYSKINASTWKDAPLNQGAYTCPTLSREELKRNKPEATSNYTSCYVFNACYTAPVVTWAMREYTKMQYQYVLAVDYLDSMRDSFYSLHEIGAITNETLDDWRS